VNFAVLGAGAWGTALACQLARNGNQARLWGRDATQIETMRGSRQNRRYLPDFQLPAAIEPELSLADALADVENVLIAVPSHAFRETLVALADAAPRRVEVAWATKGLELDTGLFLDRVAIDVLGDDVATAVLSGPSFAREVAEGLPTAVTVASREPTLATTLTDALHDERFRVYASTDIVGVQIGGAVKNIIAIAAGIADGLAFGANARAALVTRGLAEIMRLGAALGAKPETLTGLAGLGDLILTCTGDLSRNRRLGLALAAGHSREAAVAEIGQAVEGIGAAAAVSRLAIQTGVEMPITEQVYRVLYESVGPRKAVQTLLSRSPRNEAE
jgi:glycerol-3-phosphate dehydrogenase (NAD(P)+)